MFVQLNENFQGTLRNPSRIFNSFEIKWFSPFIFQLTSILWCNLTGKKMTADKRFRHMDKKTCFFWEGISPLKK